MIMIMIIWFNVVFESTLITIDSLAMVTGKTSSWILFEAHVRFRSFPVFRVRQLLSSALFRAAFCLPLGVGTYVYILLRHHSALQCFCTWSMPKVAYEIRHSFTLCTEHRGLFSLWLHSLKILARTLLTHVSHVHLYVTGTLVFLHLFVTQYATSTLRSTLAYITKVVRSREFW